MELITGLVGYPTRADWLEFMGIPADRAFTFEMETCPDGSPCACAGCRDVAREEGE